VCVAGAWVMRHGQEAGVVNVDVVDLVDLVDVR
jgi:hypothetical protein